MWKVLMFEISAEMLSVTSFYAVKKELEELKERVLSSLEELKERD